VCEYCGCRQVEPIAELMDEHAALREQARHLRAALASGDRADAAVRLGRLVEHLDRHVRREESGVFTAMRDAGEFLDELEALEGEHDAFDARVAALDADAPEFSETVTRMLDDLDTHVEREDLGIFPVSIVSLGATGWETVERAHTAIPTFLTGRTTP
jgi:hemerythrin-like domain-containing protein